MNKIIMYNVREEQKPFIKEWSENNDVEILTLPEGLTKESVSKAEGYEGVSIAEPGEFDSSLYPILNKMGIRNVAQRTAGYENFDLNKAKENNIIITNVAAYSPESIAEFTIYMALRAIRKGQGIQNKIESRDFTWTTDIRGKVLREMTIGIFGTGKIGFEVAKLFHAFGCKVIAYDLYPNSKASEFLEYRNSPEEIVKDADLISLHMPSTKDNYHLFNKVLFEKMKKGSYLINAGRGQLIDTQDMLDALDKGILAGVALDTYENEAAYIPGDFSNKEINDEILNSLLNNPKVDFTHHTAYYTETSVKNMICYALDSTLEIIKTGTTKNRLN